MPSHRGRWEDLKLSGAAEDGEGCAFTGPGVWNPAGSDARAAGRGLGAFDVSFLGTECQGLAHCMPRQDPSQARSENNSWKELLEFSEPGGAAYCCVRSLGRSHEAPGLWQMPSRTTDKLVLVVLNIQFDIWWFQGFCWLKGRICNAGRDVDSVGPSSCPALKFVT